MWSAIIRFAALQCGRLRRIWHDCCVLCALFMVVRVLTDLLSWCGLLFRPRKSLGAEILFLRRQLALYVERGVKPRRIDAATRVSLAFLSRLFEWPTALVVVRPETLLRWHRAGFRLFWRWKSRPGRPRIPVELRKLIQRMAKENPLWGQERIANELWLKLGLQVSPRTVRKYLPRAPAGRPRGDQRWSTFLKNHAQAVVACGFFVAVTRYIPAALRIHCHRASEPTVDSLQRDGPSGRELDPPAAARSGRV